MPPANRADVAPGQLPYVITFITRPTGASVTIGQQTVVAPGDIDLGMMPVRVKVVATKDGFQPTSAWLDRSDFVRSENVLRKRVYLTLPPIAAPATAAKVAPAPAPAAPATAKP
jgi:hypothetical protein